MGIQVSSTAAQRYGEALVRSGIVGKIREVHTFSNKSWGDDKPLPDAVDPVPAPLDWDEWLGVSARRPFKNGVYHPGEWRRRDRLRYRHARRHGLSYLQPALSRAEADVADRGDRLRTAAERGKLGVKARVKLTYPGTEFTADSTVDVWWYSRRFARRRHGLEGLERPELA